MYIVLLLHASSVHGANRQRMRRRQRILKMTSKSKNEYRQPAQRAAPADPFWDEPRVANYGTARAQPRAGHEDVIVYTHTAEDVVTTTTTATQATATTTTGMPSQPPVHVVVVPEYIPVYHYNGKGASKSKSTSKSKSKGKGGSKSRSKSRFVFNTFPPTGGTAQPSQVATGPSRPPSTLLPGPTCPPTIPTEGFFPPSVGGFFQAQPEEIANLQQQLESTLEEIQVPNEFNDECVVGRNVG